jgi:hypothetical protein
MSALGQKRTYAVQYGMSALPPIADMCAATRDVRFVPIADIVHGTDKQKDRLVAVSPKLRCVGLVGGGTSVRSARFLQDAKSY